MVKKNIGQYGAYHAPLWCALISFEEVAILHLCRSFQPSLDVEQHPLAVRVLPHLMQHQLMFNVVVGRRIKDSLNVIISRAMDFSQDYEGIWQVVIPYGKNQISANSENNHSLGNYLISRQK